jgi:plasmid stabilization system protein ParE
MVVITTTARAQLEALEDHYAELGRDVAAIRMTESVAVAAARIERQAGPFWPAPRPYPDVAGYGWRWLKEGRYWIAFTVTPEGYAATAIFYETANIPRRLSFGDSPK